MLLNDILSTPAPALPLSALEIKFEGVHFTLHVAGINLKMMKSIVGLNANKIRIMILGRERCRNSTSDMQYFADGCNDDLGLSLFPHLKIGLVTSLIMLVNAFV